MKTLHAPFFAVISLSLAMCGCGPADKKEDSGPPKVPQKKEKSEGGQTSGNPEPPVSDDATKKMNDNEPPAPAVPVDLASGKASGMETINGAIKLYNQKKSGEMMKGSPMAGGNTSSAKAKYLENAKKAQMPAAATSLTDLNDLVKSGLLKSIPAPPEGKKWVLDKEKQEVRLEGK